MASKHQNILDKQYVMATNGVVDTIEDLYTRFSPNVDLEALDQTEFFDALYEMMEVILDCRGPKDPEVFAYWAKRGMVKEFHGEYSPMSWEEYGMKTGYRWEAEKYNIKQNADKIWTSFVPVSAFKEENKGRKYPVLFALHGACNPVFIIDGWGYVQEAAKREWIVIVPSIELDDILVEILEEAKKLYPIDESRVFASGFSYGGWASNRLGNQRPDIFAGVAPCGAMMDSAKIDSITGDREPLPPFDGVNRAEKMGVYMPIINIFGNHDGGRWPVYNFKGKPFPLAPCATPEDLVDDINHWARVNHAKEIRLSDVMALKDSTTCTEQEKKMGVPTEEGCGRSYTVDGIRIHIADLKSEDGVVRTRLVEEENIPHWPTPEMSRLIFDFFSHFSRDPETKESIYTE